MIKKDLLIILMSVQLLALNLYALNNDSSIDQLLNDYRIASDLSNQTKKEAAGSVILFSRDKLEKMQAYKLRDVLKTIPIFTLQESITGPVSMAKATGATFNSQFIKFYINDHEVGSVVFGSAMKVWGYMDITHIDHIEVYQTGSAVTAGDEPPGMVIRLYTKDPKRDNGSQIQAITASNDSMEFNGYHAGLYKDLSYFFYLDAHQEKREDLNIGSNKIKNNLDSVNFFGSLSGENFHLDFAQLKLYQDGFLGLGRAKTPIENYNDLKHRYLLYTHYFQDKSLKFKLSYDNASYIRYDNDPSGILLNDNTIAYTWDYNKDEEIKNVSINKSFSLANHDFDIGIQYKNKSYDPNSLKIDSIERVNDISSYRNLDIYSVFLTDNISLNDANLFFYTLKYDYHVHDGGLKDTDNYVARLGYIYNEKNWLSKTFLVHTYGYPVFLQNSYFPFITGQNEQLKDEERYALSTEVHYKNEKSDSSIRMLSNTVENRIVVENKQYVNSTKKPKFYAVYFQHEYKFDTTNKIKFSAYTSKNSLGTLKSSNKGALIQLFNTIGKFDLFNELIYRSGYSYNFSPTLKVDVDDGYDYTMGITYHPMKDLTLSIKGENLFNKAIDTAYPIPAKSIVEYSSPFDRVVRVGIKYVF